jgi:adenylate cyclase
MQRSCFYTLGEIKRIRAFVTGRRVERRLAAVLAADVAGYSPLMGADEVGTLEALKAHRREVVDPAIAAYGGRIVKTTGDGLLAEFASAVDAVSCAVAVQEKMAERTAEGTAARIQFRVGITVGDVIIDGDDIFGDGVNIAARVENECKPGGVYLSEDVYRQVRGKTAFAIDDLGERSLKNIDRPVRLYAVRLAVTSQAAAHNSPAEPDKPLPLPSKPSIAVMPFVNVSGDAEQEYFADGMLLEIIEALSRIKSIFVVASSSSLSFKGKGVRPQEAARQLGVRYVLEGGVRKSGDRVRIGVQLIDAADDAQIWTHRFEDTLKDVFALQDAVAMAVAGKIEPTIEQVEIRRAAIRPTDNINSHDLYLRALPIFRTHSKTGTLEALDLLNQAIDLDAANGPALALAVSWPPHHHRLRMVR